jgi:hypothetical protein
LFFTFFLDVLSFDAKRKYQRKGSQIEILFVIAPVASCDLALGNSSLAGLFGAQAIVIIWQPWPLVFSPWMNV